MLQIENISISCMKTKVQLEFESYSILFLETYSHNII